MTYLAELVSEVVTSLLRNKLRSFLTMAGIAWGVASMVLIVAMGDGFKQGQRNNTKQLGENIVIIFGGRTEKQAGGQRAGRRVRPTYDDVRDIRAECFLVRNVIGELQNTTRAASPFNSGSFATFGVEPIFSSIRTIPIEQGRFINDADQWEARRICVMGQKLRKQLFADRGGVVGSHIAINGMQFLVIGLMANKNQNSDYNGLDEDKLYIPYTTMLRDIPPKDPERSDVDAIREAVPLVTAVSPECLLRGASVVRGYRTESLTIRSAYANYGKIRNMVMSSGRWLSPEDDAKKQRVAVLGAEAAHKLFGEIPPEGEVITLNGLRFSVAGVLRTKAQISNYNTPDNDCIFIPFDAMSLLRGVKNPDFIVWTPVNPLFRADAMRQVRAVLARTHNFSPNDERAVRMIAFNEFLRLIDTMSMALRVLLGFIGTLTLGIGGVGLANIMLVSVTQRTREIGVLKSIGATRRSILSQFLLEAMAIVTVGGALGVLGGYVVTEGTQTLPLLGPMFHDSTGTGDIHLRISSFAVMTSTIMLETVGLVAGWLPAIKASRMDPIEALRYE